MFAPIRHRWHHSPAPAWRGLHELTDRLRPAIRADSRARDGLCTLSYLGLADGLQHALPFFEDPSAERTVSRRARPRTAGLGELVLVGDFAGRPGTASERAAWGTPVFQAPLRVHYRVPVPEEEEHVLSRMNKKDRQRVSSAGRRYGWKLRVVDGREGDTAELDFFLSRMHLPTMHARHEGWVRAEDAEIARYLYARGLVFLLHAGADTVAGVLGHWADDGSLVLRLAGVLDGDQQHYRSSAQLGLYVEVLRWAARHRVPAAEFSGSRPFVSEGLFQFKRKLRPEIVLPASHFRGKQLRAYVHRDTPGVRDLLVANPVISAEPDGSLHVVYFYDAQRQARSDLAWQAEGIAGARRVDLDRLLAGNAPSADLR